MSGGCDGDGDVFEGGGARGGVGGFGDEAVCFGIVHSDIAGANVERANEKVGEAAGLTGDGDGLID